ncbi:MAG TPA: UDP-N-acetylmuramoyl-L-alanyl-D-glutamate--2,6-diaminopimelate ligase [Bacteroidales bacterium]|nr:UDP-N-acetylmuramoyl-L-alanyl-D-glutamate--2,6-diaminopimelate ligase [Bacteroidales bacterium]
MKGLNKILSDLDIVSLNGDTKKSVEAIEFDSRRVKPGTLFVAVRGTKTDGHIFLEDAVKSGAVAIICESLPQNPDKNVTWIVCNDSARALGLASSNFYGNPSSSIKLVGVTGTNGKTTIATLLYRLFSHLGYKCGLFSTICNYVNGKEYPATHTTPDPVMVNSLLQGMTEAGCEYAFMEVSSHAVVQQRIAGLRFEGGIFTNLTHDHLDYHQTFDKYLLAKKGFFDSLGTGSFALTNLDDRNGRVMLQNCRGTHFTYSACGMADYRCTIIEQGFEGMSLRINGVEVWTRFTGDFNASNLLAVFAASQILGADKGEVLTIMSDLNPVAGRMEPVRSESGITGLVDYAHTPDALFHVIETINRIREGRQKLITVVGAGGDRDMTKRPLMAVIAAEGSSKLILTSDNPRTEDPEKILDDMEAGLTPGLKRKSLRITDRRVAIRTAVMLAEKGDVILVAGKGHETYQETNGVRHHFDDRDELSIALSMK